MDVCFACDHIYVPNINGINNKNGDRRAHMGTIHCFGVHTDVVCNLFGPLDENSHQINTRISIVSGRQMSFVKG